MEWKKVTKYNRYIVLPTSTSLDREVESFPSFDFLSNKNIGLNTEEFTKRVREMSSQLSVTLHTLYIYPSARKQLRRHLQNPFREVPCIWLHLLLFELE